MHKRRFLQVLLGAVFALTVSSLAFAQSDVIEKRQKLMKSNSATAKALKQAVADKDYATIETKVKVITGNMDRVLDLFPKGSTSEKSRAKPVIWEKWDEFSKNPAKVKKAATDLAEAAKAKDQAKVEADYKALGNACNGCHKVFRAEKKSGG